MIKRLLVATLIFGISCLLNYCDAKNLPTINSYPSANLTPFSPPVNVTGTLEEYLLAGGVVFSGLVVGTVALYLLDLYVTSQADKALQEYLTPQLYDRLTSAYDPDFDFDTLVHPQDPTSIRNKLDEINSIQYDNSLLAVQQQQQQLLSTPKRYPYIGATTASRWYNSSPRGSRRYRRQTSGGGRDGEDEIADELQEAAETTAEASTGLFSWITGWFGYASDVAYGALEAFSNDDCKEHLMCEAYQRTEGHWTWSYLVPYLEEYASFVRARNIARHSKKGCGGFYEGKGCLYIGNVFARHYARIEDKTSKRKD